MEVNRNEKGDETYSFSSMGKGLQYLVQAPLFVIVGAIVTLWEVMNNLFQSVYQQGSQYAASLGANTKPNGNRESVKVPVMPIDNYSRLSVRDIVRRLDNLSRSDLQVVKQHERSTKNRVSVLGAIDRKLA
jgi:hypothetical protein